MNKIIIIDTTNVTLDQYKKMYDLINAERKEKVDKLRAFNDKKMSVICEICLYFLLSSKYKYSESLLEKELNSFGKPILKNLQKINYSFSHSNDICAVGISKNDSIGIDIESLSSVSENQAGEILSRFFSKEDISCVEKENNHREKLLSLWTKKEALHKAFGSGISLKILKTPFSSEDLKNLQTKKVKNYIMSFYLRNQKKSINYYNSCDLNNIINAVDKWKKDFNI